MNHEHEQSRTGSMSAESAHSHDDMVEPGQSSRSALLHKADHAAASGLLQRKARDVKTTIDTDVEDAEDAVDAVTPRAPATPEGAGAPVDGDGGVTGDPAAVHQAAQRGVAGESESLPHAAAIQRSFGHHDVSGIRVHVGGEAAHASAAIGARAYATGDDVAFAAAPDLRQTAHEAAHVVQQRGGVRLDGGVGRAGDAYEQHADAVAALVVRSQSAEALLDTMAHRGAGGGPAVQREDGAGDGIDEEHAGSSSGSSSAPTTPRQRRSGGHRGGGRASTPHSRGRSAGLTRAPSPTAAPPPNESRDQLTAVLSRVTDILQLQATLDAIDAIVSHRFDPAAVFAITIGAATHQVLGRNLRWLRRQVSTRLRSERSAGPVGSGPWTPPAAPLRGQTLQGHTITANGDGRFVEVTAGRRLKITHHGRFWGIIYGGRHGPIDEARRQIAAELGPNTYRGAATLGMAVLGEGGVSAINTWDDQVLTLGVGYTGGRLNSCLGRLRGTAVGAELASIPYLAGLQFRHDEAVRLDVDALNRMASILEGPHAIDAARAQVMEFIEGSALPTGHATTAAEATGDRVAGQTCPEIIGIAAYLRHGRSAFTPSPPDDVAIAVVRAPGNPSAQLAVLLKLHGERIAHARINNPTRYRQNAVDGPNRRLPSKVRLFIDTVHRRDPSFQFDFDAARAILPCLTAGQWTRSSAAPGGAYIDGNVDGTHVYWNFGPPIL
jgi:Domain of unknown function (DUF4157)